MKYLLIDGNNLIYRCFFAQYELHTLTGRRSGAVHGFLNSLAAIKYQLELPLSNIAIVWDGGRSSFRTKLYPEYKQGRKLDNPKTAKELEQKHAIHDQLLGIKEVLRTRPLRNIEVEGAEADDLIALLSNTVAGDVIVFSGDADMCQLYSPRVKILDPKRGFRDPNEIASAYGLSAFDRRKFVLARAIMGDPSDNIKGVKLIGEKRVRRIMPYLGLHGLTILQEVECSDPKTQKLIDRVIDNTDIVSRNIRLMELPLDWESPLYPVETMESALLQFQSLGKDDLPAFAKHLKDWELNEALGNLASFE